MKPTLHAGPMEVPQQRTKLSIKFDAIRAYAIAEHEASKVNPHQEPIGLACALMREWHPNDAPANPSQFIRCWWDALKGRGTLLDIQHGRTSTVDPEEAERAVHLVWGGFVAEGYHVNPATLQEALDNIPALEELRLLWDVTPATMLAHLKEADVRLKKRREEIYQPYTPEEKIKRWELAAKLRRWRTSTLSRVFWIDESHIYIVPKGCAVFAPPEATLIIEDPRMTTAWRSIPKLRFYCVVNAVAGAVNIQFTTGTTNLKTAFKVWGVLWKRWVVNFVADFFSSIPFTSLTPGTTQDMLASNTALHCQGAAAPC